MQSPDLTNACTLYSCTNGFFTTCHYNKQNISLHYHHRFSPYDHRHRRYHDGRHQHHRRDYDYRHYVVITYDSTYFMQKRTKRLQHPSHNNYDTSPS